MNGKPAEFSLALGAMTADPRHSIEANLRATLPASEVLAYAPTLQAYGESVSGTTQWNVGFNADDPARGRVVAVLGKDGVAQDEVERPPAFLASVRPIPLELEVLIGTCVD